MEAQLAVEQNCWEEVVTTFRTCTTVEQALKHQIIMVFKHMYLEILNNDMVGLASTTFRDILEHLFMSYGSITAVDLEQNFENMFKACDSQQPIEILLKQIQDCVYYADSGVITNAEAEHCINQGIIHIQLPLCLSPLK
jgi:hypothetical protein